jgi:hypothetical protein
MNTAKFIQVKVENEGTHISSGVVEARGQSEVAMYSGDSNKWAEIDSLAHFLRLAQMTFLFYS